MIARDVYVHGYEKVRTWRLKKKVYINLPPEVVEKARKHGLNISKVSENALIDMLDSIEGSSKKEEQDFSVNAFPKRVHGASGGIWTRDLQLTKLSQ